MKRAPRRLATNNSRNDRPTAYPSFSNIDELPIVRCRVDDIPAISKLPATAPSNFCPGILFLLGGSMGSLFRRASEIRFPCSRDETSARKPRFIIRYGSSLDGRHGMIYVSLFIHVRSSFFSPFLNGNATFSNGETKDSTRLR